MKLLLDTHAALWWLSDDRRLGSTSADLLDDASNEVLLSAAVVWEVAIKRSLGKLKAPDGLASTLMGAGVHALPITIAHADATAQLDWHHRDPFDRMLVAQAMNESAMLYTADRQLTAYSDLVVCL